MDEAKLGVAWGATEVGANLLQSYHGRVSMAPCFSLIVTPFDRNAETSVKQVHAYTELH